MGIDERFGSDSGGASVVHTMESSSMGTSETQLIKNMNISMIHRKNIVGDTRVFYHLHRCGLSGLWARNFDHTQYFCVS